jgi:hypothetical protein
VQGKIRILSDLGSSLTISVIQILRHQQGRAFCDNLTSHFQNHHLTHKRFTVHTSAGAGAGAVLVLINMQRLRVREKV